MGESMSGEAWTVNSEHTKRAFFAHIDQQFEEHKYLTFPKARIGADRSLNQNALFHVWLTEYAAHLTKTHIKMVPKTVVEGMKKVVKRDFYAETAHKFMVHEIVNPWTGGKKVDYTSSADWKRGEIYMVLEWLQMKAANDGLVLESKGEYAKLKRQEAA